MYVDTNLAMETSRPKNDAKRYLDEAFQPNYAFISFHEVWSWLRQLLPLLTGELWPLGPCERGDSSGEGRLDQP